MVSGLQKTQVSAMVREGSILAEKTKDQSAIIITEHVQFLFLMVTEKKFPPVLPTLYFSAFQSLQMNVVTTHTGP